MKIPKLSRSFFAVMLRTGISCLIPITLLLLGAPLFGQAAAEASEMIFWSQQNGNGVLYLTDIQSKRSIIIGTAPDLQVVTVPRLSQDGRHIVFETFVDDDQGIYVQQRGYAGHYRSPAGVEERLPSWSPQRSQLAFWSLRNQYWNLYLMDGDGANLRQLTQQTGLIPYDYPFWSPDGHFIILRFWRPMIGSGTFIVNVDDPSGSVEEFPNIGNDSAWSPDSRRIAFRSERDLNGEIYLLDIGNRQLANRTTNPGTDFQPNWSPDGDQLAFVSNRSGPGDIYVLDNHDGQVRQLSSGGGWQPMWSPDGRQIAFVSKRNGSNSLYLMDADGSNVRWIAEANDRHLFLGWFAAFN